MLNKQEIIDNIRYFKHKPEVVNCYLKDIEEQLNELPICQLIEIQTIYNEEISKA